jgi:threonine dehydratase
LERPPLTTTLVDEAAGFLSGRIRGTPIEESRGLSRALGARVFLKLENLQETGSFKIRGALFALSRLPDSQRRAGVLTCSAGNHGKALAWAGRELAVRCVVCLPASVDSAKLRAIEELGAEARISRFPGYDETEEWAREQALREGLPFLSAFDDNLVIAANGGTLAREVLAQRPDARTFVLPVGGGGLAAGFSFVVKETLPDATLIGCQHEGSPGLKLSLDAGRAITRLPPIETAAGGIEGGIGVLPFEVLRSRVDGVVLSSEQEILEGLVWMLDRHQYLIEPSAAVVVAACLAGRIAPSDGPVVAVISGRNVSKERIRTILNTIGVEPGRKQWP